MGEKQASGNIEKGTGGPRGRISRHLIFAGEEKNCNYKN